jgi:hypothetical protein
MLFLFRFLSVSLAKLDHAKSKIQRKRKILMDG